MTVRPQDRIILPDGEYEVVGDPEDYASGNPFGVPPVWPALFTVQRRPFQAGATDAHGNPVKAWASAVSLPVFGWGPVNSTEPKLAGHDRVVTDLQLFVPPASVVNLRRVAG